MSYYDVKDKLPPIDTLIKVFHEMSWCGGYGLWQEGKRISDIYFQIGKNLYAVIDFERKDLGVGVTHWADMDSVDLPNLCRRTAWEDLERKNMLEKAKKYGIKCHADANHLYDNQPYSVHLEMVFDVAVRFIELIPEPSDYWCKRQDVLASCWVHDVIEDARQTYNDVLKTTNVPIAEIAYALTNDKGKNRAERAGEKYYQGIKNTRYATFVKLCDRIANFEYSYKTKSRMFEMYKKENEHFISQLWDAEYFKMFDYLRELAEK